jgi:dihydroorotase
MPNTVPQTTSLEALDEKFRIAATKSHVNYSFFFGATNDNTDCFSALDRSRIPGIKLFMGSSTGNMLVDRREALERIFSTADMPIMAHCEDTAIINRNMAQAKERYGEDPDVRHHPEIRSAEACYESTRLAVELARKHHARLHVAHITTARELELIGGTVTAEATVSHLYFCDRDYAQLGTRIKCNPAIKTEGDREALQQALNDGRIAVIGTDHAPHLLAQKEGGCARAASGMPMIQFSLVTMLELVDRGVLTLERLVELMCHNPARLFGIRQRGFLRPGYRADMVLVRPNTGWTVSRSDILSKCGWSPMEGHTYLWQVQRTICNGHTVYHGGTLDDAYIGEPLCFDHDA